MALYASAATDAMLLVFAIFISETPEGSEAERERETLAEFVVRAPLLMLMEPSGGVVSRDGPAFGPTSVTSAPISTPPLPVPLQGELDCKAKSARVFKFPEVLTNKGLDTRSPHPGCWLLPQPTSTAFSNSDEDCQSARVV